MLKISKGYVWNKPKALVLIWSEGVLNLEQDWPDLKPHLLLFL